MIGSNFDFFDLESQLKFSYLNDMQQEKVNRLINSVDNICKLSQPMDQSDVTIFDDMVNYAKYQFDQFTSTLNEIDKYKNSNTIKKPTNNVEKKSTNENKQNNKPKCWD